MALMIHYRLASQVTLQTEPNGKGSLFISHPQRIIKLSRGGVLALQQLCGGEPADLSQRIMEFAQNLENQGVIIREFPQVRDEQLPSVTVVIPTYGRPQMLANCLESLRSLDYPANRLEIIVVDDASPQPIEKVNWAPNVQLIRLTENKGPGEARNRAVQQAQGEIIAFLDDDCLADRHWLRTLVPCFRSPDVAIIGGRVEAADLSNSLAKYEQVQSPLLMGTFQRKVRKSSALSYLPTCNLLIRKASFFEVGGFDPVLRTGEDVDLCWRVLETGTNIYFLPAGVVYHYHRTGLISFLGRRFNYGQSEATLQAKHQEESRCLSLFPGHSYVVAAALLIALVVSGVCGKNQGLIFGMLSLVVFDIFNLGGQIAVRLYRVKSAGYSLNFGQVGKGIVRAHNSALYLYSQNFSRYYSILLTIIAFPVFPMLAVLFLIIHLWPAIVDYGIKKPVLSPSLFIFYSCLENYSYQAGVLSGCWQEHNWRPLVMDLRTAEGVEK